MRETAKSVCAEERDINTTTSSKVASAMTNFSGNFAMGEVPALKSAI